MSLKKRLIGGVVFCLMGSITGEKARGQSSQKTPVKVLKATRPGVKPVRNQPLPKRQAEKKPPVPQKNMRPQQVAAQPIKIDIGVNPSSFVFAGYSGFLGVSSFLGRLNVSFNSLEVPRFVLDSPTFIADQMTIYLTWDYKHVIRDGFFAGLFTSAGKTTYANIATKTSRIYDEVALGLRLGYRLVFASHLNLAPWVTMAYSFDHSPVEISGKAIARPMWLVLGKVDLGWIF